MKNFTKSEYLKSEYNKINKLFLSAKFEIVIEKSMTTQRKFSTFLSITYRYNQIWMVGTNIFANRHPFPPLFKGWSKTLL